jgi:Domain of unknown function (DUF4190)
MRRCPYCAEDIADDTTRCPHCNSDLTAATAPAATAAPAGPDAGAGPAAGSPGDTGAVQFSYSGQRYLLGYGADFFGIWDRGAPGPPVERFPRTDDGWSQAWTRYASLEPNSQPVQAAVPVAAGAWGAPQGSTAAPTAPAPAVPYAQPSPPAYYVPQQPRTNGMAVASLVLGIVGLILFGFLAIPPVLALIFGLVALSQTKNAAPGSVGGRGMAIAGVVLGSIGIVFFIVWIIAIASGSRPGF